MKKAKKYFHVLLLALLCVFTISSTKVNAAEVPGKPTGLKQTYTDKTSFDFEWSDLSGDVEYEVYVSTDNVNWTLSGTSYSNSETLYGLTPGSSYYVKVRAFIEEWDSAKSDYVQTYGTFSDVLECVTEPEGIKNTLTKTASTTTSLTFSWQAVQGATGYLMEYYESGNSASLKNVTVTDTTVKLTGLKKDAAYVVSVTPFRQTANGSYTAKSDEMYLYGVKVTPSKVKDVKGYVYDSEKELAVNCSYKDHADGYQFQVWTAYGSNKKIKTVTQSSAYAYIKNKNFAKSNMFKVRVRAYIQEDKGKIYGAWSDWKYVCKEIEIKKLKCSGKGIKLTWDKINGADRYVIYASTSKNSGYKKVKTINKGSTTSYTVTKINKKSLKKGKTYYFYVVPYNKVNGKYYKAADTNYCYYIKYKK